MDPHSAVGLSDLHGAVSKHISLDWKVDFDKKIITGNCVIFCQKIKDNATSAVFDTKGLKIHSIADEDGNNLNWRFLSPEVQKFSDVLFVDIASIQDPSFKLKITYETIAAQCTAVQWLLPEMTAGKKYPYLFTQCQAIHARTLLPCHDSPSVKVTYSATVSVPAPLTALMSAIGIGKVTNADRTIYSFKQEIPIPCYLFALAVGNLEGRKIGKRSTVWSEPEVVQAAQDEFSSVVDSYIDAAEALVLPYLWKIYDVLVLPFSFPYGGMENPCLTFVTPALLAGDKSMTDVVAHEIAHSWTGNLVSAATWNDFWLNEGFTVFFERKILAIANKTEDGRHLDSLIGLSELKEDSQEFISKGESHLTALVPDLKETHPDDSFSRIPYELGHTFLYYLENEIVKSKEEFELFFSVYIRKFAFKSVDSLQFKEFFMEYFKQKLPASILSQIEWDKWYYGTTGEPPFIPAYSQKLVAPIEELLNSFKSGVVVKDSCNRSAFESFTPNQKILFLDKLIVMQAKFQFSDTFTNELDNILEISNICHAEVRLKWLQFALSTAGKANASIKDLAVKFLETHGRMKYIRPVYRALAKADKSLALETFKRMKESYHPIASKLVAKDLQS